MLVEPNPESTEEVLTPQQSERLRAAGREPNVRQDAFACHPQGDIKFPHRGLPADAKRWDSSAGIESQAGCLRPRHMED